jgi:hypothetical protein
MNNNNNEIEICDHHHFIRSNGFIVCVKCGYCDEEMREFEYRCKNETRIPIHQSNSIESKIIHCKRMKNVISDDRICANNIKCDLYRLCDEFNISDLIRRDAFQMIQLYYKKTQRKYYKLHLRYILYLSCLRFKRYIQIKDLIIYNQHLNIQLLSELRRDYYQDLDRLEEYKLYMNYMLEKINHAELMIECYRILKLNYDRYKHLRLNQFCNNIIYQLCKKKRLNKMWDIIGKGIIHIDLQFK